MKAVKKMLVSMELHLDASIDKLDNLAMNVKLDKEKHMESMKKQEQTEPERAEAERVEAEVVYSPMVAEPQVDCQHFFRQIFLGYFSDIVQAFDTLRKNVCGDDYTSLHNPIVLSSVLPAYGMFHSIQILFL